MKARLRTVRRVTVRFVRTHLTLICKVTIIVVAIVVSAETHEQTMWFLELAELAIGKIIPGSWEE